MSPPDENDIDEKDVIDSDQPPKSPPEKKQLYRNIQLATPPDELDRIKKDYNTDDVGAAIIYHNERKRPGVVDAVKKIAQKERKNRIQDRRPGSSGVPEGLYIPEGTEKVLDAAGEIQADSLKSHYADTKAKSEAYEEERERLADIARHPKEKEESFGDELVEEYIRGAMDTDKQIKQKALDEMLHGDEKKKKQLSDEVQLEKIKQTIKETYQQKVTEAGKEKTFDEELLGTVKKDLIAEMIKKLKGEGMKMTPELVGQVINGIGSVFDKLDPVFAGYNTKQNILASKEKMMAVAQIHAGMNADNIRTLKDMVYLMRENKDALDNPILQDFIKNMNSQSSMVMGVIRKELEEPIPTAQSASKKREQVDLDDIPTEEVPTKKKRKTDDE